VVETVCFFARQRQHLLGAGREIVHCFFAHNSKCLGYFILSSGPPAEPDAFEARRLRRICFANDAEHRVNGANPGKNSRCKFFTP
jgi:hypothetical protein